MKCFFKIPERLLNDNAFMKKFFETLYLLIFAIILSDAFLHTTMFLKMFSDHTQLHIFMKIGLLVIIVAKLSLTDERDWRRTLLIALFITCFFAAFYRRSHYEELLTIALLIVGANQISFRKILKVFLTVGVTLTLVTMIASQIGIIQNLTYLQKGRGVRISFGSVYPTDFSAHILYLVLAYIYLREKRLKYFELGIFVGLAIFIYSFCDAKTNAGCIIVVTVICFFIKFLSRLFGREKYLHFGRFKKLLKNFFVFSAKYSMLILSSLMVILTLLYTDNNAIMIKLDKLFTTRLALGKTAFNNYPVGLLGQYIEMKGLGGKLEHPDNYFFIDSSYVKMILCYGLLVYVCVLLIYLLIGRRAQKRNNMYLLAILGIISIQCMFEHHILEIAYNPFTLAVLAKLDDVFNRKESIT